MIYCLSCKKPTEDVNIKPKVTKKKKLYTTYGARLLTFAFFYVL